MKILTPHRFHDVKLQPAKRPLASAETAFQPQTVCEKDCFLPKLQAMERAAAGVGKTAVRPPINVAFKPGANPCGVEQPACNLCGNCVTGCNTGAKSTLLMNYLPDAWNHGAEIFTQVDYEGGPGTAALRVTAGWIHPGCFEGPVASSRQK